MATSLSFIDVNQITKNYRDPSSDIYFQALRGIDLEIHEGSLSAIIGPSGAGKSTLLSILGGMTQPSTGTLFVDDIPLHSLRPEELANYRRRTSGFLWQLPQRNLLPGISIKDNIRYAMEISGYREDRVKRVNELLDSVGLKERGEHKLGQLSGGEAQRAGLAVALANEPRLLLADEPTGELDSETTGEIISYLESLNTELGITIVVVTHDHRFERMTGRAYNIVDGVIAGLRRPKKLQKQEREEVGVVNQFGMVKIPPALKEKYKIENLVRFLEDEENNRLYIEPAEEGDE